MDIALTTRWNAGRHATGEAMLEEILALGFRHVELGYDTRVDLLPGIRRMVQDGAVQVNSVHNFCPVPMTAHRAHPELYTMGHRDPHIRELAVKHTKETIRFAAEIGAKVVVTHCGNIDMPRYTPQLIELYEQGDAFTPRYERIKDKCQAKREKKARRQLDYWRECVEQLLPTLAECRVLLAMENMPTWEAIPTEGELATLLRELNSPWLKCWHDMGHGKIREFLGFINAERWLERLQPYLAGMHVHDAAPPVYDHIMPPLGQVDFTRYRAVAALDIVRVIEPTPRTPAHEIQEALRFLQKVWASPENNEQQTKG